LPAGVSIDFSIGFAIPILAVTRMRFGGVVGYTLLLARLAFAVSAVAMRLIPARRQRLAVFAG